MSILVQIREYFYGFVTFLGFLERENVRIVYLVPTLFFVVVGSSIQWKNLSFFPTNLESLGRAIPPIAIVQSNRTIIIIIIVVIVNVVVIVVAIIHVPYLKLPLDQLWYGLV